MEHSFSGLEMDGESNMHITASSASVSHLLFVIQKVKMEIVEEMGKRFDSLHEKMSQKVEDVTRRAVEKILNERPDTRSLHRWDESKALDRSGPTKPQALISYVNKMTEKDRWSVPLLQWFLLCTVVRFTCAQENSGAWVEEEVYRRVSEQSEAIAGASGFSFLFAVANTDGKGKYQSSICKFWTFVLRSAIVSFLLHEQKSPPSLRSGIPEESSSAPHVPPWIAVFGNKKKTCAVVNLFVNKAETKAEVSGSERSGDGDERQRKRRRLEKEEYQAENRGLVVLLLRKNLMRNLTYGRTDVRAYLFEHLLFIVEKIDSFPSVEAAKEGGFEIVFPDPSIEEAAVRRREDFAGSIWDLPSVRVTTVKESRRKGPSFEDAALLEENRKSFIELQQRFPSLTVLIKFKNTVIKKPDGRAPTPQDVPITWPVEEYVSLHTIATGCLIEAFKRKDANVLLSSGSVSLKAVHVLAIALRGLLRNCLGLHLSEVEMAVLGDVTHKSVKKGENKVTAMMSTDATSKRKRKSQLQDRKLQMAWETYLIEKEKLEEEERLKSARSMVSERSEEEEDDDDDDDDDEEWMNMTVAAGLD